MSDILDPDNPVNAPDTVYGVREWQDINQLHSRHGLPAVHSDDWATINAMADAIGALDGLQFELDSNWIARRIAADMLRTRMLQWDTAGERVVDTRYCSEYDDSQVATMSRWYALTYNHAAAFPFSDPSQYEQVAAELLEGLSACTPVISDICDDEVPIKLMAVRRGDYVCLFKLCRTCREALEIIETEDDPDYIGPKESVDDRTWEPDIFAVQTKNPWTDQLSEWQPPQPPKDDDPWAQ